MSLQAITTKYIGPGNVRGSRLKVECAAKTIFVEWEPSLGVDDNHEAAARALASKLGWKAEWFHGVLKDGRHVFVQTR